MVMISDVSTRNKDFGTGVFTTLYPYSEIHMTLANMILTRHFLYPMNTFVLLFITLLCAGLVAFFAWRFKPTGFMIATLLLFLLFISGCGLGFIFASVVPITIPIILGFSGALTTGSLLRYIHEEKQRLIFKFQAQAQKKLNLELSDTLFGHKKGAYTGADSDKPGLIEKAGTGTLFLDEIGDLTKESQKNLLRLIQENEYLPLGANSHMKNRARIEEQQDVREERHLRDNIFNYTGDFPTLEEMKEHLIREAMKRRDGKISDAARLLGISRFSLSRWLKEEIE